MFRRIIRLGLGSRFSDIVAFDMKTLAAYIIDPTVRYERSDKDQDKAIQEEKAAIYNKCIAFYEQKLSAMYGSRNWSVRGLLFSSRGCYGKSVIDFLTTLI